MNSDKGTGYRLENTFEKIYKGKTNFYLCLKMLLRILLSVCEKGYITEKTGRKIEGMMSECLQRPDCMIVSCNSGDVVLFDESDSFTDHFRLSLFIEWFVNELINDPLFRQGLHQHYDYQGVKQYLDSITEQETVRFMNRNIQERIVCDSTAYCTEISRPGKITLLRIKDFRTDEIEELMPLCSPTLLFDRENGFLYVNHIDGNGRRIEVGSGKGHKIDGNIVTLLPKGEIVVSKSNSKLLIKRGNHVVREMGSAGQLILNPRETDGISWFDPMKKGERFFFYSNGVLNKAYGLKTKIVWEYILGKAYHFHRKAYEKISDNLWFYKCHQVPLPFTHETIMQSIAEVEKGIVGGLVRKSKDYVKTIWPLMHLQDANGDITDKLNQTYHISKADVPVTHMESVLRIFEYDDYFEPEDERQII